MRSSIRYMGMGCLALLVLACGDKGDDNTGTGGTAGAAVTGGAAGVGTGGTAGATGGSGGATGGSAGSAATADSGTGAVDSGRPITQSYTFDTDVQMWRFQYASVPPGDAGIPLIPMADVMVTQDPTRGNPTQGALQAAIPYSSRSQYVGIGISYGSSVDKGVDLTGKIITAKVQLVSGLGTDVDLMSNPGGAKLYIKTGTGFVYAAGLFTNIPTHGNWIDLDFDMDFMHTPPSFMAPGVDVTDVRELGIQFDTGGMSTTASPAVLLIDTVSY